MIKSTLTIKAGSLYNGVLFGVGVIIPEYDLEVEVEVPDTEAIIGEALGKVSELIVAKLEELPQAVYDLRVKKANERLIEYYKARTKEE